jgi:cell division protease FtsH
MHGHQSGEQNRQQQRTPWQSSLRGGNWRYILWFALLWFIVATLFARGTNPRRLDLAYSGFKQQVKQDNVTEVTIQGERIQGVFKQAVQGHEQQNRTYKHFTTVVPSVGDADLLTLLEAHDVTIHTKAEEHSWLGPLLISVLPWVLLIGLFVYAQRRMRQNLGGGGFGGGLFGFGRSKAKRFEKSSSTVSFSDVAGLQNAKKELVEIVAYLKDHARFRNLGGELPKGVLLVGAPGTGKTLLARAVAGEANVPFFSTSGSEFIEMFVGVGASRVRDMFANAKKEAPAIIFIDELDSIGRSRGTGLGGGHDEREQTLNQILAAMDGFAPHESVVVLAATNRPDVLDPALTRPGRFDRQVTLELPQKRARQEILRLHTKKVPLANDVDLNNLAARTVGFSGADLKNLVNEATLLAGRKRQEQVESEDFEQARDKILMGSKRDEPLTDDERRLVAYHESGHALVARLLPGTDALQKVTIIPRGRALGATEQVPETERHNLSRTYLLNRLAVMLGGRAAEKLTFQDVTNGAGDDLKQATRLARRMVCQWGMSDKVGAMTVRQGEEHVFLGREIAEQRDFSEHTARLIDEEIKRIIHSMEQRAEELLKQHCDTLERLAEALLEHETLDAADVDRLVQAADLDVGAREWDGQALAPASDEGARVDGKTKMP